MKICLLGEFTGNLDEAMRKTSFYLAKELSIQHEILTLDLRAAFKKRFWEEIKNFDPDIIHYLHGPSINSFILTKIISIYNPYSKIIMSAMRPMISYPLKIFIPLLKPDLILVQSARTEKFFKNIGFETSLLFSGVDTEKFKPVSAQMKAELRSRYGFNEEDFIFLHIGSIKEGRNVLFLKKLKNYNQKMLIIGSSNVDSNIKKELIKSGIIVWSKYIKNIEEIYMLADCYLYPTVAIYDSFGRAIADSIETPLSVLEAMATNLPVITTKFGALSLMFKEGDGLIFAETEKHFLDASEDVKLMSEAKINTRSKVLEYSWDNIAKKLCEIYENVKNKR